jgi:hypothetical protein
MTWQLIFSETYQWPQLVDINHSFSSQDLIIAASCGASTSWRRAGWLIPLLDLPGIGIVEGASRRLNLTTQALRFEVLGAASFTLRLRAVRWLPNVSIQVWQPI